jgi:hypothetical protein
LNTETKPGPQSGFGRLTTRSIAGATAGSLGLKLALIVDDPNATLKRRKEEKRPKKKKKPSETGKMQTLGKPNRGRRSEKGRVQGGRDAQRRDDDIRE